MTSLPMVSVVIPMRNEADTIGACLDGLLAQDYPPELVEILVVDGVSSDDSRAVIEDYARRSGRVRLLDNPRGIVPPALNTAIRSARGTVIVRIDGHTRVATDYVRTGVETLERTGAQNVGGPMHAVGGGVVGDAIAAATSSRFGVGSYFHYGTEERDVDTVYLGMWPRNIFSSVGMFDEEFVRNQDDEFNYRLRKSGGRIVLNPAMRSWYQNRKSFRHLIRQYFQYGEWKVRVLQKHPRQMSWRHFVPPTFVAMLLGLAVAAPLVGGAGWLLAALAFTYLTTIAVLGCNIGIRAGWRACLATSLAFGIIHLAWGSGFLVGLIRHAGRWGANGGRVPHLEEAGE